jgi:predicted CoA-substrate-specific enzyme activase
MDYRIGIDIGSDSIKSVVMKGEEIIPVEPIKIKGKPLEKLGELLNKLKNDHMPGHNGQVIVGIAGKGSEKIAMMLSVEHVEEIDAIVASANRLMPDICNIIEIGAESQAYLSLYRDEHSQCMLLEDAIPGGKCAGGTGSFLDYMHKRLKYDSLEEFIQVGLSVESPAGISGRCAVFAESDIVHHYQKGTPKERIVAGIHQAVARNYKSMIQKSKAPADAIALIGGVAHNECLRHHMALELGLKSEQLIVPRYYQFLTAIGAGLRAHKKADLHHALREIEKGLSTPFDYASTEPISLEKSRILDAPPLPENIGTIALAALGVDIGSVSTKAALVTEIDGTFHVLASHYRRTEGNPIKAVQLTLAEIRAEIERNDFQIETIVAATTGSGRYLTGYFIGAHLINDEITAQASGTSTFFKDEDITIIEIGGQDSKFIQLKNGAIADFEMNWACAAGTGALIEKHAKNLDIDIKNFGALALAGDRPPIINSTCAVFSESALVHFQQNNVSVENLCAGAAIASAKNYLVKVVRSRPISDCIVFQGAVAFNRGMVGSFETLLSRPICVPAYPHLTGAIGAARLAYDDMTARPVESPFKGFGAILNAEYNLSSFQCAHCHNECHVNRFVVGEEKFFQGDRCDRYSAAQKKKKKSTLPDLFEEREELLMTVYRRPDGKKTGQRVGIPRGLLFSDYYPFFNAFFSELGFDVIPSERTNKRTIARGIQSTVAEPCFPVKVAHGHVAELLEKAPEFIFLPAIISAETPVGTYDSSITCPYVQSAPDVIKSAFKKDNTPAEKKGGPRFLAPTLFFDRGDKHVERVFKDLGKEIGRTPQQVTAALKVARKTLAEFRDRIKARGEEIFKGLNDETMAFIIIGRPYAIHDSAVNMDAAKKVLDEGYLPIPLDYLPLHLYDASGSWPNIYSVQGQKKLAAAKLIAEKKNLHALVVTYFGCGPDAFLDQMFKEEIGRHYLTIQIDEHTSDTGMITRIQAYLNSAGHKERKEERKSICTADKPVSEMIGKILWVPSMNGGSAVLASSMRAFGIDARVLPRSTDPGISLARKYICGDVCLPMLHTSEDMLTRATAEDFSPRKEAFFQGKSGGPCRYGMYFMLEKNILDLLHGDVDVATLGNKNSTGGLGNAFLITVWDALVAHDVLEKMLFHTRPYEEIEGSADQLFERHLKRLCEIVEKKEYSVDTSAAQARMMLSDSHLKPLKTLISGARGDFEALGMKKEPAKPLVGIVGEFFVRLHEPSNQYIIRHLEAHGAEVWLAPITEFFGYSNYISGVHARDRFKDTGNPCYLAEAKMREYLGDFALRDEHALFREALPLLHGFEESTPEEVVTMGERYVNKFFGGEAILSMGKSEDFARKALDGIVSVGPFNCMPSLIVSALSRELRRAHGNIPFLNLDYDGYEDSARDKRLAMFMSQVRERRNLRAKEPSEPFVSV